MQEKIIKFILDIGTVEKTFIGEKIGILFLMLVHYLAHGKMGKDAEEMSGSRRFKKVILIS